MDLTSIILQILCMGSACLTVWLIGSKKRMGFMVGMLGQVFWLSLFVYMNTLVLIGTSIVYFTLYLRGWIKWGRENERRKLDAV